MATARSKVADAVEAEPDNVVAVEPAVELDFDPAIFGEMWDGADELDGADPVDKDALLGVPFVITGARFYRHKRSGASLVELEARYYPSGEVFSFQDSSSTGVRAQVIEYLISKEITTDPLGADDSTWFDTALKAPAGLRVSVYDAEVPVKGQPNKVVTQKAKTYYIRPNGKRAARRA